MKGVIVYGFLAFYLAVVEGLSCPNGWTRHEEFCFLFKKETYNWFDAKSACQSLGGYLAEDSTNSRHQFLTGLVQTKVLGKISDRNCSRKKTRRNPRQHTGSEKFSSMTAGSTFILLYCICILLLTLCMDVELNPGPDDDYRSFLQTIDWRFSQVMYSMQGYMTDINKNLNEKFARLDENLIQLTTDINKLNNYVEEDRDNIRALQEDRDYILQRLGRMEIELEATEIEKRKNNLKFLGVEESDREDYETSTDYVVELLNVCTHSKSWRFSDIEKTFRIGKFRRSTNQPRPMIVVFHRWADKMKILRDPEIRNELRSKNIRVTTDFTPKQRNEVEYYRQQGKKAYYRNGKLQVDDRQPSRSQHRYHQWTKRQDQTDERGNTWKSQSRYPSEEKDSHGNDYQEARGEGYRQNHPQNRHYNSADWDQQNADSSMYSHRRRRPQQHSRDQEWQPDGSMKHVECSHRTARQPLSDQEKTDYQTPRGYDGNRGRSPTKWISSYPDDWGPRFPNNLHSDDSAKHSTSGQGRAIPVRDRIGEHRGGYSSNLVLIGLQDFAEENSFVWDHSGRPMETPFWRPSEPQNWRGEEDCVALHYGGWDDVNCEDKHESFICEKGAIERDAEIVG